MAKAGSCKMGLKPNPLGGDGIILSKGFDALKTNIKKPIVFVPMAADVFHYGHVNILLKPLSSFA